MEKWGFENENWENSVQQMCGSERRRQMEITRIQYQQLKKTFLKTSFISSISAVEECKTLKKIKRKICSEHLRC
jgi:hypothetical protein